MSAVVRDLSIEQGTSFDVDFTLPTGTVLTDYVFTSQIREQANAAYPALATPTITADSTGDPVINWALTAAQTAQLPASGRTYAISVAYTYDIIGTKSDGTVVRFFNGTVRVSPAVTRS